MLDYTLVSTKATYRLLTPQDVPFFVKLVQACREEMGAREPFSADRVLATIGALQPRKGLGSIYVFEREQRLVGYCALVNGWSSEQGGTVLVAEDLYVVPDLRVEEIAEDFLTLLVKVAPEGSTSIRIEIPRANRKALSHYARLGFRETGRQSLTTRIERP